MDTRKAFVGIIIAQLAAQAGATGPTPAWQTPGYVMEEIVVTLPRAEAPAIDVVAEIVVTLSLEEQARIRSALHDADTDIAARPSPAAIRL